MSKTFFAECYAIDMIYTACEKPGEEVLTFQQTFVIVDSGNIFMLALRAWQYLELR